MLLGWDGEGEECGGRGRGDVVAASLALQISNCCQRRQRCQLSGSRRKFVEEMSLDRRMNRNLPRLHHTPLSPCLGGYGYWISLNCFFNLSLEKRECQACAEQQQQRQQQLVAYRQSREACATTEVQQQHKLQSTLSNCLSAMGGGEALSAAQ